MEQTLLGQKHFLYDSQAEISIQVEDCKCLGHGDKELLGLLTSFSKSVLRCIAGQKHQEMIFVQESASYYQALPSNNHFSVVECRPFTSQYTIIWVR